MSNEKISEYLIHQSVPQDTDRLDISRDIGGTPETAYIEWQDIIANIPTLYTADGVLSGNRSVDQDGNAIGFINGNFGIGTTTPTLAKVQVEGDGNTSATKSLWIRNSDSDSMLISYDNGALFNKGSVSIGSTAPGTNIGFAVTGTQFQYQFYADGDFTGGDAFGAYIDVDTSNPGFDNIGGYFNVSGGDNNYAILVNAGYVGIGTVIPSTNLHVSGGFRYVDGAEALGKVLTSDGSGNASWQTASGASSLSTTLGFGNTSESNDIVLVSATAVTDGALINSDKVVLRAQYDADPTAGVTPTDYDADIQHIVDTGGATPASHLNVRLNGISRATLSDTGFLTLFHGSGTNKGLKVTNNSNYGVYLGEVAGTRSYIGFNSFYRNSGWWQSETTSAATVEYLPAGYLRWTVATGLTANVDYSTDTAEKMRLTTTGLGIGTTTVSSRLHVKGSGTTSGTTTLLVENFIGQDVIVGYDNSAVTVGTRSAGTIGGYSFVAGKDNKATNAASNAASYALGIGNDSSGIFSGALGAFNIASGRSSLATGEGNTASGDYSFSAGQNNSIAGAHSFGAGNNVTITNRLTFAYGYGLNSTADQACIIGRGGDAALNRLANPNQYSLMIGFRSEIPTLFISDSGGIGKVGNVGVGTTVFGSNAESVLGIKIKTAPTTAPADMIQLYAKDSSDGAANATLALQLEQAVEAIGTFTPSHKLKVWINGVEYWIQLDAV